MKIKSVTLQNFRGYRGETTINFDDLTALVGRNDIGKSTVMEALDIFFNDSKGIIKLDKNDVNIEARNAGDTQISITVRFTDLPEDIVIDSVCETSLAKEYMLNAEGELEIIKRYSNGGTARVFLRALHPTHPTCGGLLLKKDAELRAIIKENGIDCRDQTKNYVMRASIWKHFADDLRLETVELDVSKGETKSIWSKLQGYLPLYSLFQADRKNSDGDSEVQDPLKEAVRIILQDPQLRQTLDQVAETVVEKLKDVSDRTMAKFKLMSPDSAHTLTPVIPPVESLKWSDVFKSVSIASEDDIPVNKRGSGIKRMILLSFFQAEVEHRRENSDNRSIIYAIEEPETAQHYDSQRSLVKSLLELAKMPHTQVILTTHSATVVKALDYGILRLIRKENGSLLVDDVPPSLLPYPSLNEVNFLAFNETTAEYFDELYGHLEESKLFDQYKVGKPLKQYWKLRKNGTKFEQQIVLTEYVRHQIHHPENKENPRFTEQDLYDAIVEMRAFLQSQS